MGEALEVIRQSEGALQTIEDLRSQMEFEAERIKLMNEFVARHMTENVDYGLVPGAKQKSLFQAGAEKMNGIFKLAPTYEIREIFDPNIVNHWKKRDTEGDTVGYYEAVATCTLTHAPTGNVVGSAVASCNSWESKYESLKTHVAKNTVLQMAEKRAYVRATRTVNRLSMVFTQDIEDMAEATDAPRSAAPAPRPAPATSNADPDAPEDYTFVFGKNKGKRIEQVDMSYLEWLVKTKAGEMDDPTLDEKKRGYASRDHARFIKEIARRERVGEPEEATQEEAPF